jgi:hypothetical protein
MQPDYVALKGDVAKRIRGELVRNAAVHGRGNKDQELALTITVERGTNLYITSGASHNENSAILSLKA